jgi:6-pyruvoyl-tetrahydropterin synthase
MDLKRVEETWRILDTYSEQVWPGWKNCSEVPFRIDYPNGLSLQIGEPRKIGKYKLVDGMTLRGKKIYLDDSRLNSLTITSRLYLAGGGAGGGAGKKFEMNIRRNLITSEQEKKADSLMKSLGNSTWPKEIVYSTDQTIVILTHELFHCFTNFAPLYYTDDTLFISDLNYAVFAEIEGELLEKAAFELDSSKVKYYLKESFIAEQIKRHSMTNRQQEFESDQEKAEGTATYVEHRIVQLLKKGYEPGLTHNDDPLYYSFRFSDYFSAKNLKTIRDCCKDPVAVTGRNYGNGFFKCLILDKLMPAWKNGFFENKKSFDQLIGQLIELKKEEQQTLLDAMKKEYQSEKLIQRYSPIIAERDSIIKYFQNPFMNFYAVNIKEMAQLPIPDIVSSGAYYRARFKSYYLSGITNIRVGDMTCDSKGIPVCYDIPSESIILPDRDSQKDGQVYDLKYSRQDADSSYSHVTITSKNFTLHATKLRIVISPTQVEFKILPAVQ